MPPKNISLAKSITSENSSTTVTTTAANGVRFAADSPKTAKREGRPVSTETAIRKKSPAPTPKPVVTPTAVVEEVDEPPTDDHHDHHRSHNHSDVFEDNIDEQRSREGSEGDDDNDQVDPIRDQRGSEYESNSSGSDLHSRSSGSGSSNTMSRMRMSTLPFGMSLPTMMMIMIMIPILFLCVYTGMDVGDAMAAQKILSDNKFAFEYIFYYCARLQELRKASSGFLALAPNSTEVGPIRASITATRKLTSDKFADLIQRMQASDIEHRLEFLSEAQFLMRDIERVNQAVDDRAISGFTYRQRMVDLVDSSYFLMIYIAKDSRVSVIENRIVLLVVLRRMQNSLAATRACGTAILSRDGDDYDNRKDLWALKRSIDRDLAYLFLAGTPAIVDDVSYWSKHPDSIAYLDMVSQLEQGNWTSVNLTEYLALSDRIVKVYMAQGDAQVLETITNGEILNAIAVVAGMKMFGAVFACILATLVVIFYNNREQARLNKALDSTAILAAAVQRFVPKNQLRTMGVRSITQVVGGMSTEVASCVIFTDVCDFSKISESMPPLELFNWLQNYVARMNNVITDEKAYIANFLGDGLMIIANQPTNGLNACIKMHVAVGQLNLELISQNSSMPIRIGVGISFGILVFCVFGDENRLTCSAISSVCNEASRLEHLTRSFGAKVIASNDVIERINPEQFLYRCLGKVQVSGSKKALKIYDVYNCDELHVKDYKTETKAKFEEAVALSETEPEHAGGMFRTLLAIGHEHGYTDKACASRLKGVEMDARSSAASSAHLGNGSLLKDPQSPLALTTAPNGASRDSSFHANQTLSGLLPQSTKAASFPLPPGVLSFEKDGEIKVVAPPTVSGNSSFYLAQLQQNPAKQAHILPRPRFNEHPPAMLETDDDGVLHIVDEGHEHRKGCVPPEGIRTTQVLCDHEEADSSLPHTNRK